MKKGRFARVLRPGDGRSHPGPRREKRQALVIIVGYLVMVAFGTTFAFILPAFGVYAMSGFGPATFRVYYFSVSLAVFRFRFLKLTARATVWQSGRNPTVPSPARSTYFGLPAWGFPMFK